ncbi:alpha/beta hydrolase family protein [Aureivirga marina]|uniref:alpha/beta hydrolase family protein n=1 Tax=Aureivirga marina TaxID=1182451 RepID=UPI0018CB1AA7|nr:prolyl oligopeptidase family serine peptidase [Aureivirga marina]
MKTKSLLFLLFITFSVFSQNGKIQSKKHLDLSKFKFWKTFTKEDGTLKEKYKHLDKIDFHVISYKSDEHIVSGIIAEPKKEGKFPVIIFNRGGNKEIGNRAKMKTLFSMIHASSKLVQEGYIVIASCYREQDEFGGNDINDVLYLTETVKEIDKADSDKIGMFGWSRGGMMTYLSLKMSDKIKTAVVGNGVSDLKETIQERPMMEAKVYALLIPDYFKNKEQELKNRSVIHWTEELNKESNLLILYGTKDKRVNPKQAEILAEKLREINYNFEIKKFDTDHKFSGKDEELNTILIQWFKENL